MEGKNRGADKLKIVKRFVSMMKIRDDIIGEEFAFVNCKKLISLLDHHQAKKRKTKQNKTRGLIFVKNSTKSRI